MIISRVSINGFGPHGSPHTVSCDSSHTLITGANGSGKTTIFDAILWALFGPKDASRAISGVRTSVIHASSQRAEVSVVFVTDDGREVTVTRSLSREEASAHRVSLVVDGQHIGGGISDIQQAIGMLIGGISRSVFSAYTTFSTSPRYQTNVFVSAPPATQRALCKDMIDPTGEYDKLYKEANKNLSATRSALRHAQGVVEGIARTLDMTSAPQAPNESEEEALKKAHLAQEKADQITSSHQPDDVLAQARREVDYARQDVVHAKQVLRSTQDVLKREKQAFMDAKKAVNNVRAERDHHDVEVHRAEKEYDTLCERIEELNNTVEQLEDQHHKARMAEYTPERGEPCPVCGEIVDHDIPAWEGSDASHYAEKIAQCRKTIADLMARQAHAASTMNDDARVQRLDEDERTSRDRALQAKDRYKKGVADWEEARRAVDAKEDVYTRLKDALNARTDCSDTHEEALDEAKNSARLAMEHSQQVASSWATYRVELEHYNSLCSSLDEARADLETQVNKEAELVELRRRYSPDGDISDMIDQFVTLVSSYATDFYQLCGGTSPITCTTQSEKDGSSTLSIMVGGRDSRTLSHGEYARLTLSMMAALVRLHKETMNISLPIFLDEAWMSMDGDDAHWQEVCRELFPEHQILETSRTHTVSDGVYVIDCGEGTYA